MSKQKKKKKWYDYEMPRVVYFHQPTLTVGGTTVTRTAAAMNGRHTLDSSLLLNMYVGLSIAWGIG